MDLTLRPLDPTEVDAFIDLDDAAFSVRSDPARRAATSATVEWPRMLGAFDPDGLLCGATGSFTQTLTLPGGARVPVAGVTAVGVLPTHRRRGVLTTLMAHQLDDVAERGEPLAVLTASEATIYRRFGYGVATRLEYARVDRERSAFRVPVQGEWWLRLVDDAEAVELAPAVFDAHVASRPGGLTRPDAFWPAVFSGTESWVGGGEHFTVVCGPAGGPPSGYAIYRVKRGNPAGHWTTVTSEVVAVDPEAEAQLWRFLLDVDLTSSLEVEGGPGRRSAAVAAGRRPCLPGHRPERLPVGAGARPGRRAAGPGLRRTRPARHRAGGPLPAGDGRALPAHGRHRRRRPGRRGRGGADRRAGRPRPGRIRSGRDLPGWSAPVDAGGRRAPASR